MTVLGRLYARQMVENEGDENGNRIEDPERFLTALLIGNTAVNFAAAITATVLVFRLLPYIDHGWAALLAWVIGVFLLLVIGELLPRAVASRHADKLPKWFVQLLMSIYNHLLSPIISILTQITSGLLIILTGRGIKEIPFPNITGLALLTEVSEKEQKLEEDEREMIQSIFEFGDTLVREVMVPRIQVKALDLSASLSDILDIVVHAGHSRIPVYEGTIDNIVGILHAKDLLHFWKGRLENMIAGKDVANLAAPDYRLQEYLRKPFFIPENKPIAELLQELRATGCHLAIVVDEYGGTAGIVTIEDILEEIVGEIHDEYDQAVELLVENPDGSFTVDTSLEIEEIEERLGCNFPEDDYETLGGYMFLRVGDVPEVGTTLDYEDLRLTVLEADDRRIHKIRIERIPLEVRS